MTLCLCGLLAAALSAGSADLATTAQFTARDYPEVNPLARPFVQGRGSRGEMVLGALNGGAYVALDRAREPWRSAGLGAAVVMHTALAIRNVRGGMAIDVPRIVFPVLVVRW